MDDKDLYWLKCDSGYMELIFFQAFAAWPCIVVEKVKREKVGVLMFDS